MPVPGHAPPHPSPSGWLQLTVPWSRHCGVRVVWQVPGLPVDACLSGQPPLFMPHVIVCPQLFVAVPQLYPSHAVVEGVQHAFWWHTPLGQTVVVQERQPLACPWQVFWLLPSQADWPSVHASVHVTGVSHCCVAVLYTRPSLQYEHVPLSQ